MIDPVITQSKDIAGNLEKGDMSKAYSVASRLVEEYQNSALAWFSLGEYYLKQDNVFKAINCFNKTLKLDPSFVMAAQYLVDLNGDNYSVGELKYLYLLITRYKAADEDIYEFLDKFTKIDPVSDLSAPDVGLDDMAVESLPGTDNQDYIEHLIREMDDEEAEEPEPAEETRRPDLPETIAINKRKPQKNNQAAAEEPAYKIETLTMARLYMRQGLYEQARNILLKLQSRNPGSGIYKEELKKVDALMGSNDEEI